MVKFQDTALDRTFAALADPTRRALLARLNSGESASVSELARPLPMSLPAVMKHIDVLSDAGLVIRTKTGRTVSCQLNAAPMEEAMGWLNRYQLFWSERLDRLAAWLQRESARRTKPLEHRTLRTMAAAEAEARGRGELRPGHRQPLPPWHQARSLPPRQSPKPMHVRTDRACGEAR